MAWRFDTSGEYVVSAGTLPAENLLTLCGWVKISVDTNALGRIITVTNGTGTLTNSVVLSAADGVTIALRTGATQQDGIALTVGQWYFMAYICDGNDRELWIDGTLVASHTVANSFTVGFLAVSWPSALFNGCFEGYKLWDAVLTPTELAEEALQLAPVRTANINRWSPGFWDSTKWEDFSSQGADWSVNGSPSFESGSGTPFALALPGSYALAGQAVSLLATRQLSAEHASFALNGQDVDLLAGRVVTADAGSFALNGQTAPLLYNRLLPADFGAYAFNGQDVTLTPSGGNRTLDAEAGSFQLNGQTVDLRYNRLLQCDAGSYTINGQPVDLLASRLLTVDPASYALGGQDVQFARTRVLETDTGFYSLLGQDVQLIYSGNVPSPLWATSPWSDGPWSNLGPWQSGTGQPWST